MKKIENLWLHWENRKNIYHDQTKWDKQYIHGITKDFCIDLRQKQTELLAE